MTCALEAIGDIGLSVACHSDLLFNPLRLSVPLVCTLFPNVDRKQRALSISRTMYQYIGSVKSPEQSESVSLTVKDKQAKICKKPSPLRPPHQSIMQTVPHIASFLSFSVSCPILSLFILTALLLTDYYTSRSYTSLPGNTLLSVPSNPVAATTTI